MTIFVIAKDGTKLMPTHNVKKVRKLLRTGRAVICKYKPFTIKLNYDSKKCTQPIEFKEDAGYQNIGVSACSAKHEYISETRILLKDEVEKHNDCLQYRKKRRNRLRYRKPRFNNRTHSKKSGWLAPSIKSIIKNNCFGKIGNYIMWSFRTTNMLMLMKQNINVWKKVYHVKNVRKFKVKRFGVKIYGDIDCITTNDINTKINDRESTVDSITIPNHFDNWEHFIQSLDKI